jgi:hypothetical protein
MMNDSRPWGLIAFILLVTLGGAALAIWIAKQGWIP